MERRASQRLWCHYEVQFAGSREWKECNMKKAEEKRNAPLTKNTFVLKIHI